jgi:hypothetical protein
LVAVVVLEFTITAMLPLRQDLLLVVALQLTEVTKLLEQ